MRALACITVVGAIALTTPVKAENADYIVADEKDHSFGNVRSRVTLEIEIPDISDKAELLKIMMRAAVDRHRQDWPDAVSVRFWGNYENDQVIQNSTDYAPDGCGWSGDPCSQPIWTDLLEGEIPANLIAFGTPTEAEKVTARPLLAIERPAYRVR